MQTFTARRLFTTSGVYLYCAAFIVAAAARSLHQTPTHAELRNNFCSTSNDKLGRWLHKELEEKSGILPSRATDFESFLAELKDALDARPLPARPIFHLLSDEAAFQPTCAGDWLEFGVFKGETINLAAKVKQIKCGESCSPVYGFDTFTGLPEEWARSESQVAPIGEFNLNGKFPPVESNVQLVQGKFAETLPLFELQHRQHLGNHTLSFLHIDCDLYSGAVDVLRLLNNRIKFGTLIVFDDLVNYKKYREGEVKALWEWLQESGARLATVGILGPLDGRQDSMDIDVEEPSGEHPWFHQSVAFVVTQAPSETSRMAEVLATAQAEPDASERDPVLAAAEAMEGDKSLGALGHGRHKAHRGGAAAASGPPPHRVSRGTRDRRRAEAADVRSRESIIPLDELDVDPEGDFYQERR